MKKKNYRYLIISCLLSFVVILSCQKATISGSQKKDPAIPSDPISKISVDKDGNATILTKSGQKITQNVLVSPSQKSIALQSLNASTDSTSGKHLTTKSFRIPLPGTIPAETSKTNIRSFSSVSSSEPANPDAPNSGYQTFTLTRYPEGYVNVVVLPPVVYIDDYVVRATPFVIRNTNPVLWEINYVYTRNGSSFYSTQVSMSTYVY